MPQTPTDPVDVAARADLGAATRWWEFVGAFSLTEKGTVGSGQEVSHFRGED